MPEPAHKRQLISTVYNTPLMTPTTDLGLSILPSMFELRKTGDWTSSGLDHCPGRHQFLSRLFLEKVTIFAKSDTKNFSLKSDKDSGCSCGICRTSATPFRPKNRKETKKFEIEQLLIGQLCLISEAAKKTGGRHLISDKIGKTGPVGGNILLIN